MDTYGNYLMFWMAAAACITFFTRFYKADNAPEEEVNPAFKSFQTLYLVVYVLAFLGDWLQGPYVYALYSGYGFSQNDIAVLFVAGFGSSMIFGTFIGSLADKFGRKKFAVLYCILYIASCCTKHFPNYWMLMLGRVLGGIATSLLFSVFESWMVAEHNARGFAPALLSDTFSKAMFGNSLIAIISGFVANYAADLMPLHESSTPGLWIGGNASPFDVAIVALSLCWAFISIKWGENFGSQDDAAGPPGLSLDALKDGAEIIRNDTKIFIIGICSACFEGSMYTFVFLWTPLLTAADSGSLPFGNIFAVLMLSCMSGSQIFSFLVKRYEVPHIAMCMYVVASASLLAPLLVTSPALLMGCFSVFEVCVGIYWPCLGTLKGIYVPEAQRSAIYNIFRIPLNAIVLFVLLSKIESRSSFICCGVLLLLGAVLLNQLKHHIAVSSKSTTSSDKELDTLLDTAEEEV